MSGIIALTNLAVASTNALLNFLLPQVIQFAQRADLPEKTATVADVRDCRSYFQGYYHVTFKNGDIYRLCPTHVQSFESPHSFESYGPANMTEAEAIDLARSTIRKLGYTEEMLYADLKPEVDSPASGTNILAGFRITWPAPNRPYTFYGSRSAEFEINGTTKEIEKIWFMNDNLQREKALPPDIHADSEKIPGELSTENSQQLALDALPRVNDFAKALNLWPETAVTTNQLGKSCFFDEGYRTSGVVKLTNGFSFSILAGSVTGFSAPDVFFSHDIRTKDFLGKWTITEAQAISLARKAAISLGAPAAAVAGIPEIQRPYGEVKDLVPRCVITWNLARPEPLYIRIEIDGASGTIKSLTILAPVYSRTVSKT